MLDKQINLFSVNTDAFLTNREKYIKSSMMRIKNDMYDVSNAVSNVGKKNVEELQLLNDMYDLLKEELKEIEKDTKESLKLEFARTLLLDKNKKENIRVLDERYIRYKDKNTGEYKDNLNNIVSMFTSDLSRSFGIETDELTKDIVVVEIWYYDVGKDLILNGFYLDGKKYVYFSSSAGQIRTKKAVFVEEQKYEQCKLKLMCGLTIDDINAKGGMNINKFLAYLALCNSATETWKDVFHREFDIDRCVVVDDFETNVVGIADYIDYKTYEIEENKEDEFSIPHMDGAGIIISSYTDKNFMVRLPFIKGLLGSFDYIRFIEENNCSSKIKDIWGKEYDVIEDNIQIIFTKSQLKLYKYYESWDDYKNKFREHNCDACVCNIEESHIPNAKINYQMLQTLHDMSHNEIIGICKKSNQKIENISNSLENMLDVFGVSENKTIHEKNYFKQALKIYPELIKDKSNKDTLRDLKNSLVNKYKSSKLEIDGKFIFVLPDLYAFCEWLFMGIENPMGLISNGEVSCKPYKNHSELDCLRSPSLYIEHAIRRNVYKKKYRNQMLESWFTTNAIYISTKDLISRILQLDVDGDKLLVVAQNDIVRVAKRHMEGVNPLYYEMKKANSCEVNNANMYNGLRLAFSGGKIGGISNDITKIWNSGNIGKKELNAVKWLVAETNYTIDYAKTLFKPTRPEYVDSILKNYSKSKNPYFFKYAKGKLEEKCEPINNSTVNEIAKSINDRPLRFDVVRPMANVDYKMFLCENANIDRDAVITLGEQYDKLNKSYGSNLKIVGSKKMNEVPILNYLHEKMDELGYSREDIVNSLVVHLYKKQSSKKKKLLWSLYGDIMIENLKRNINEDKVICMRCGRRVEKDKLKGGKCPHCRDREIKETNGMRTLKCVDCGEEFQVGSKSRMKIRCDSCQKEEVKRRKREAWREKNKN